MPWYPGKPLGTYRAPDSTDFQNLGKDEVERRKGGLRILWPERPLVANCIATILIDLRRKAFFSLLLWELAPPSLMSHGAHSVQDTFTSFCIPGITDSRPTFILCVSHCDWSCGDPEEEGLVGGPLRNGTSIG